MLVADRDAFSHEEPVGKHVEAEAIQMRGARNIQRRDSFSQISRSTEVLGRSRLSLGVEDKARRHCADQFRGGRLRNRRRGPCRSDPERKAAGLPVSEPTQDCEAHPEADRRRCRIEAGFL